MSASGKSLLFLLQRCVAATRLTLPTAIKTRSGAAFAQQRTWTSATRTVCPRVPCQLQSGVRGSQRGFCTKTGAPCEDDYPPLPAYQSDSETTKDVYIVQVKGLPWSCTSQDLLQFFSECRVRDGEKGVHLTVDGLGRPTGRAFIEMEHEEDVGKALEKHRQYLGSRYVEVFGVTNTDAETLLKTAVHTLTNTGVVMLRGLPYSCTEDDVAHFFSGLDIVENGITFVKDFKGRNSGEAYVEFSSPDAVNEALQKDRELIGSRYIEIFPSKKDDIRSSWRRKMKREPPPSADRTVFVSQTNHRTVSPKSSDVSMHHVHMRGLPFQVSGEDIVKFFFPLPVSKILLECGPDGRASGEADVYFCSHKDAVTAMSRDREKMDHRYIELFLNSVPDSY